MSQKTYLAVDIGASSGRHILGHFDGSRLTLEEVYRFENGPTDLAGSLYWNLPGLWSHVKAGITAAKARGAVGHSDITSVGVDTWGVDYALLGRGDVILGNPYAYRDGRTDGMMEKAFQIVPRENIFQQSGLQFMQFNTLFQFLAMKQSNSPFLDVAESFLMMPDLFHWLLSGEKSNEFTNATTTQFYDPVKRSWAFPLLESFGLPTGLLGKISEPGTTLGTLRESVAREIGLSNLKVVLPGSHDTASAVMSVPTASATGKTDWCYISLGTWALMGIESPTPVVNDIVSGFNFTNEGGVGGTTRILKNICGLWLIQECRRVWVQQGKKNTSGNPWDWEDLNWMCASAQPLVSFINPDAREFLGPTDMPKAIQQFCQNTGQTVPAHEGAILRCALDSIAMKFRQVLEMCEKISGNR
ncbi:MAG: rhamnulokinase, partial [Thermoguttaceae bacterium]